VKVITFNKKIFEFTVSNLHQSRIQNKVHIRLIPPKLPLIIIVIIKDCSNFHISLLASERRFQCTKEHKIWILHAKVMNEQSLVLKAFLPHRYIIDFGDVHKVKMGA